MIWDVVRLGEINWSLQTWKTSCEDERGRLENALLVSAHHRNREYPLCSARWYVRYVCVFVFMAQNSFTHFNVQLSVPKQYWGKHFFTTQVQKLDSGNVLFTALACDGRATPSIPITDCHFDGDATRTERNSLNSSLWNTVYFLEGHKATSER